MTRDQHIREAQRCLSIALAVETGRRWPWRHRRAIAWAALAKAHVALASVAQPPLPEMMAAAMRSGGERHG